MRWIGEPETGLTSREVGGKSLNAIKAARLLDGRVINGYTVEVPSGFALEEEIQQSFLEDQRDLTELDPEDALDWEIPDELRNDLKQAYETLEDPVSARSSALGEDSEGDNFAGRYESEIGLEGFEELLDGIKRVIGSQFHSRVREYQEEIGFDGNSDLRILVQEAKDADVSAVIDSRADSEGRVGFNINEGLPETIVNGEPVDQAFADLEGDRLVYDVEDDYYSNSKRETRTTLEGGEQPVEMDGELMKDEEIEALVRMARELEEVSGEPGYRTARDMEVGIDRSNQKIYLYQDRPVPGSDATDAENLPDIEEARRIAETQIVSGGPDLTHYERMPAVVLDESTPNPDDRDDAYTINGNELEELDDELEEYALVTESYNEVINQEANPEVVIATQSGFGGHLINVLGNENVDTEYMSFLGSDLVERIETYDELGVAFNGLEGFLYEADQ
jgi:hypothetical protein